MLVAREERELGDVLSHQVQFQQAFSRIDDNKTELFSFLATNTAGINTNKQVITTHLTDVLCTNRQDVSGLAPCTHEEADTRMLLHLEDAVPNA